MLVLARVRKLVEWTEYLIDDVYIKVGNNVYRQTISKICDTFQSFVIRHRLLTEGLIKQGFWYSKLCKFFKKFVRRYYALFSKYGVSVRTHVHEGICIPLVVKHELSRHITTSRGRST